MELSYYEYLKDVKNTYKARLRLVNCLKKNGGNISKTAKEIKTTRKTVRKIKLLTQKGRLSALEDQRKGPKCQWKQISSSWQKLIKKEFSKGLIKTITNFRLFFNRKYGVSFSYKLFWRICSPMLKEIKAKPGNHRKHKKKHKRKAYWREKYQDKPLLYWQTDPKYLDDIQTFYPQMIKLGLPRYQLGFRDVVSGSVFISYTYSLSTSVLANAAARFLHHLGKHQIPTDQLQLQSDNDTAIVGPPQQQSRPLFTRIVEDVFSARHERIPPGACWQQGYIEAYNWTCELEFYAIEQFKSLKEFLEKAYTYQLVYNLLRPQPALGNKTPYETAKKVYPDLKPRFYLDLPPIIYHGDEPAPKLVNVDEAAIIESKQLKKTINSSLQSGYLFWEKSRLELQGS